MTSQISKCGTCGPSFYLRAFEQLRVGDLSDIKGYIRLLQVMTLSYRPLRLEEFASVSALSTEESTLEAWVDRCASFLIIRGDYIEFVHKSAQDFLKGEMGQSLLDSYEPFQHREIALSCVSYLAQRLRINLMQLPRPDSTREYLQTLKDEDLHILLDSVDYAATFWVQHLCDAHPTDLSQKGLIGEEIVMVFLHKMFLEWLECLSLLNRLPLAFDGLKALENLAEDRHPVSIFAREAKRFFLRHYHTLENWPLQAYSSAIIFSPQSCVVRTNYIDKMPGWLAKTPSKEKTWTALIQEIGQTSRVTELAISPDRKRIVSRCIDRNIKLWNTVTGDHQTLGYPESFRAMALSPDGKQIVSISDKNIKLWDAVTGCHQRTIVCPSDFASAVAFSPDSRQIASSFNENIRLWDAVTGEHQKTLIGHSGSVCSMSFSPNGEQIVSRSGDESFKIWDVATGDHQQTLGYCDAGLAAAFSPNGKQLVSRSYKSITLWDIATGHDQKIMGGYSDGLSRVTFTPDGKQIVSSSYEDGIIIWDAATGNHQKTLGHAECVTAMALSFDGKLIVSGSDNETIKIWDATLSDDYQKKLIYHSASVVAVAFSPDGKQIVSSAEDNTIKLWDAATGDYQKTLEGLTKNVKAKPFERDPLWVNDKKLWNSMIDEDHKTTLIDHSDKVAAEASLNNKQTVSTSFENTIKLWRTVAHEHQKTLVPKPDWVFAMAFYPDGKLIASSSNNNIELWDTATGEHQKTLIGDSGLVSAVAFSADGKQIVSSSKDKTINLWDLRSSFKASKYLGRAIDRRLKLRPWRVIKTPENITTVKFSPDNLSIITNIGPIWLKARPADEKSAIFGSLPDILYTRDQWIWLGELRILRLLPESVPRCYDIRGDQIVIGLENGQVLLLNVERRSVHNWINDFATLLEVD